ncbi:MAG: hypothetical protein ACRDM1_08635 [Gaiellaceae bacterium]
MTDPWQHSLQQARTAAFDGVTQSQQPPGAALGDCQTAADANDRQD